MKSSSKGSYNKHDILTKFLADHPRSDVDSSSSTSKSKKITSRLKKLIEDEGKKTKPKEKSGLRRRFKNTVDVLRLDNFTDTEQIKYTDTKTDRIISKKPTQEFLKSIASKSVTYINKKPSSSSKSTSSSAPIYKSTSSSSHKPKSKSSSAPSYKSTPSSASSSRSIDSLDILKKKYEAELEKKKVIKWEGFPEYHVKHLKTVCGASVAKYPLKMLIPESNIPTKVPRRIGAVSNTTLGGWIGKPGEIEGKPLQKEFITKILEKQSKKIKELKSSRSKDLRKVAIPGIKTFKSLKYFKEYKGKTKPPTVTRKNLPSQNYKEYEKMIEKMEKSPRDPHLKPLGNVKWMNEPGTYEFLQTKFEDTHDLSFILKIKHFYLHFLPKVKTHTAGIKTSFRNFIINLDKSAKEMETTRKDNSELGKIIKKIISKDVIKNLKLLRCLFATQHYRLYHDYYRSVYFRTDKLIEEFLKMKQAEQCKALDNNPTKYFKAFINLSTAPKTVKVITKTKKTVLKQKTPKELKKEKLLETEKEINFRKKLLKEKKKNKLVQSQKLKKEDLRDTKNIKIIESEYAKGVKELQSTARKLGLKGFAGLNKSALTNLIHKSVRAKWKGPTPIKELEIELKKLEKTNGTHRELKIELDKIKNKIKNHPENIINYCDTRAIRAEMLSERKDRLEKEKVMLNQEKIKKQILELEHLNKMITKFPNPWIWKEPKRSAKLFFEEIGRVEIRKVYTKLNELELLKKLDSHWRKIKNNPKILEIFESFAKKYNKKAVLWKALVTRNYNLLQKKSIELTDYEFASFKLKLTEELFNYRNNLDSFKNKSLIKDPPRYVTSVYGYADASPTIPTVVGPLKKIPRKPSKTPPDTPPSKTFIFNKLNNGSFKPVRHAFNPSNSRKRILKGTSVVIQFNPEAYKYYLSPPKHYKIGMSYRNTVTKKAGKGKYIDIKGNYLDPKFIAAVTLRNKPEDTKRTTITRQDVETAFKETYYKEQFPSLSPEIRDFAFDNAISLQDSGVKITLKSLKQLISKEEETETVRAMNIGELQLIMNNMIKSMSKKCRKGLITVNKAKKEIENKATELQEMRKEPPLTKRELTLFKNQLDCSNKPKTKKSSKLKPSKQIINFDNI